AMLSLCHSRFGQHLYLMNKSERANENYKKAKLLADYSIKLKPDLARGYVALALHSRQVGDWPALYRHAKKAIKLDKSEYEAHTLLGDGYSREFLGRKWDYEKSLGHYSRALELKGDFLPARYNLALLHFAKGQFKKSVAELKLAIKIRPENASFYYYLALSHKRLKDYKDSLSMIQRAIALDKSNAFYHDMEGQVFSCMGESEKAVQCYKVAISKDGKQAQFYYRMALEYSKLGRKRLSVRLFRKSIELDGKYDMPHYAMAVLLEEMKYYKLAIGEYQAFIRLSVSAGLMEKARERLGILKKLVASKANKSM
ncbi:MAG: tetratricopeptide repeat protein, partial [Spirochaetota bacterium]|nr:tetratricopeptide repeat protein [Spirochaetota bacterium]